MKNLKNFEHLENFSKSIEILNNLQDSVSTQYFLFVDTVSTRYFLFIDTVSMNRHLLIKMSI